MDNQNEYSTTGCERFGELDRSPIPRRACAKCQDRLSCDDIRSEKSPTEDEPSNPIKPRDRQSLAAGLVKRTKGSLERSAGIEKEIAEKTVERQVTRSTALQQESEGETAYNRFAKILKTQIQQAENKIREEKDLDLINDKEHTQQMLFIARSRAVKETLKDAEKFQNFIQEKYKPELKYRKENKFPLAWMTKDKRINQTLDRYELLTPLLNYIFNLNRYTRGKDFDKMVALNDQVLNGERYGEKEYNFSSFVTDQAFYTGLIKALGKTKATWEKHIYALADAEIIFNGGRTKAKGGTTLYLDGYFMPYGDNGFRKVSFLKNNKEYREALRAFNIKW
jgi:hypothetical protein